ncbi:MAG: stage V sporulation protein AD, partial [Oscillospiraceae bacterium]|nr:stage V sporulation protein AD [Oscillospiraceae bacterium]
MPKRLGRQTVALDAGAVILSHAAVGGKMEGEGPLGGWFDYLCDDSFLGKNHGKKR